MSTTRAPAHAALPHGTNRSGGPSQLITLSDDAVWEIDAAWGVPEALGLLVAEVGAAAVTPGVNCRGLFAAAARPLVPRDGRRGMERARTVNRSNTVWR